jgi:hypothetical protein
MKSKNLSVVAIIITMLLLTGCPAILDLLDNLDPASTTTTLPPTTTTTLSEPDPTTLSNEDDVSGYDGKESVVSNGRQYIVRNNVIDSVASQTVEYSTDSGDFAVIEHSGSSTTMPVSFPSIFIGHIDGHATTDSGLPKRSSSAVSVPATWDWSDADAHVSADFLPLFSLWFTTAVEGSISGPEKSLEIWLFTPDNHNPSGSVIAGNVVIENSTWTVWRDGSNIAYAASSEQSSVNFDLKSFINDAVSRSTISNSDYLHDVIAGFRIWSGGAGLSSSNFSAVVQ